MRVAYGLAGLAGTRDDRPGESFADWLLRHRQSLRSINLFWATVLVSALNERLEQMDVGHARKVFLDGFLRNRTGFQPEIPLVPLGELYGTRLESWLRDHDVEVRLTTGVSAVELDDDGAVSGVVLRSGEEIAADFVVLAVPFDRVRGLIPETIRDRLPALADLDAMRSPDHRHPSLVRPAGLPVRPRGHAGPVDPVGIQPYGHPGTKTEDRGLKNEETASTTDSEPVTQTGPVSATGHQRFLRSAGTRQSGDS